MAALMTASTFTSVSVYADTNITVGQGSGYDYHTVQDAINSIKYNPSENNPVNIVVDKGVYEECVTVDKPYVNILGKGKAQDVVITYDKASGHSDSSKNAGTEQTATFSLTADAKGFTAKNITFQNSYNLTDTTRSQTQAVAFMSQADKVVLSNCRFIGRQDTLYLKGASKGQDVYGSANNARVYLDKCYVEGTVDFIFGDATAYFNSCDIFMAYSEKGGHFTAPNTTLFNIGYVFNGCKLSVDKQYTDALKNKIDLGRPWQCDGAYPNYGSQSVFINCQLPTILNDEGFRLWDSNTVANKVRFMEFGSKNYNGGKADLSKRADFVTVLTKEQAEAYDVYNVLSGNDKWNPAEVATTDIKVADITLDNYGITLPLGESYELKPVLLPIGAKSKVTFSAESDNISIENGKIIANKEGSTTIKVQTENGFTACVNVTVAPARTPSPEIAAIKINHKDTIKVGDKLTANYRFTLDSDNKADQSKIRWYALKDGELTLLKEGIGDYFKTYTVQNADVNSQIVMGIMPASKTTYGNLGKEVQVTAVPVVQKTQGSTTNYLREGFSKNLGVLKGENWKIVSFDGNGYAVPTVENASLEYNMLGFKDASYEFKIRCNPELTGLSNNDVLNFYMNNSADSYYRLEVSRGSNMKSLKLNLYKGVNGGETVLYADENKLKGAVLTNNGKDNTYMYVTFSKKDNALSLSFRIEGAESNLISKTVTDSESLADGNFRVDFSGKPEIWMLDTITIDETKKVDAKDQIRVYLAGDSTMKYYGDDNSIGGWGEYVVNYFDDGVNIINKAEGGRSTRSYINQGRLDEIVSQVKRGDYVFIQFGHNDNRTTEDARIEHSVLLGEPNAQGVYPKVQATKTKTPDRIYEFYKNDAYPYEKEFYPYESGTFKWYMEQYILKVKEKGGIPVIITPVCRVLFDADGKIQPAFGENNGYKLAAEQVAEENGVTCIDAYTITKNLYESYGILTTQGLHDVKDDGTMDLTHYNKFGANIVASKLADAVGEKIPELGAHLKASTKAVSKTSDMKTANLFVVGDSGKSDEKNDIFASHGFSEYIQDYLSDKITVKDYTQAGATAKNFASTKQYKDFLSNVKEGDYVMISFGRFDSNPFVKGHTTSGLPEENTNGFYYNVYNYYVKPVVEKKAVPILLTPINSRKYDNNGVAVDTSGTYDDDIRAIVTNNSLYFVNLTSLTYELYKNMGEEGSKVLNAVDSKSGINNDAFSEFGAELVAKQVMTSMKSSSATLKNYINDSKLNEKNKFTRGQFVEGLALIADFENRSSSKTFKDVVKGKSYEKAISAAAELGIAKGDSNGCFYPEAVLDGESMREMLEKTLEYKNISNSKLSDVYELSKEGAISSEIGLWALVRLYEILY